MKSQKNMIRPLQVEVRGIYWYKKPNINDHKNDQKGEHRLEHMNVVILQLSLQV